MNAELPSAHDLQQMLLERLKLDIQVEEIPSRVAGPGKVALFHDANNQLQVAMFVEQNLSNHIGAAITRIPPGAVPRSPPRDTEVTIEKNLHTLCEAMSTLLAKQTDALHLSAVEKVTRLLPEHLRAIFREPTEALHLCISIGGGYDGGRMSIVRR